MIDQKLRFGREHLPADVRHQLLGCVLQHHRLQGKATALLFLEHRSPAQTFHRLHQRRPPHSRPKVGCQRCKVHGLPLHGQAAHHQPFQHRQARRLLVKQRADAANDGHILGQEDCDVPAEDGVDGLPNHLECQRVARVACHQRLPVDVVTGQVTASQQCTDLGRRQAARAYRADSGLFHQERLLPAGQQKAARVIALREPRQRLPVALVPRAVAHLRCSGFQHRLHVIQHQQGALPA